MHRDVKIENIVVDENYVAKLCDFGMAGQAGKQAQGGHGTIPYMAPELFAIKVCLIFKRSSDLLDTFFSILHFYSHLK